MCEFQPDEVISSDFLLQGYNPATAGTMRHNPAERVASEPRGITNWQRAGFMVDVGEVDLTPLRQASTIH